MIYQLKVTLEGAEPAIWRRFIVPSTVTLHHLHLILQDVMGWTNSHLYRFEIGAKEYGEPDEDNELYFIDSHRTKLGHVVAGKRTTFKYEYDFGDSWVHELALEDILQPEVGTKYPGCLAGERACPPEDCGGIGGYERLLGIIVNPSHEEYQDMMYWLGGKFDPTEFSVEKVNKRLKPIRLP